jgi:FkbM family methyltransferase
LHFSTFHSVCQHSAHSPPRRCSRDANANRPAAQWRPTCPYGSLYTYTPDRPPGNPRVVESLIGYLDPVRRRVKMNLTKKIVLYTIRAGLEVPARPLDRYYELQVLKRLLNLLTIDCVIDVGANRGQFAHELRAIGYTGYLISFEPVHREYVILSESLKMDTKWRGYQLALGAEDRTARIHVITSSTVMSSLLRPLFRFGHSEEEMEDIGMKRLDGMFDEICSSLPNFPALPRVFLKMDTQGYDLEVFKGAERCIGKILALQSELSIKPLYDNMPDYHEALHAYEQAGFEVHNLSVVSRVATGGLQEINCLMRRRDIGGHVLP